MGKKTRVIEDEDMYHYFHQLAHEGKLDFLKGTDSARKNQKKPFAMWNQNLTAYHIENMYRTRKVLYSEEEVLDELCMIDDILRIFQDYFNIPGLERLLINNYGAIENNIFMEHDGISGAPKKIREHYKHQFRNAYLGSILLLDYEFLNSMAACIMEADGIIPLFIREHIENSIEEHTGDDKKTDSIKRIVYKSYFLGALFHDIGYPLEYFIRTSKQIHNYAPFYRIITSHIKTDFIELKAGLSESLLFQSVENSEIEDKYLKDDHGCLSAISFLLNFYHSGSVFSLEDTERCIIELTALAIYKHTDKLKEGFMSFREDPVSYLLRLCDDLQEWGRFMLVIDNKHNYLRCCKCSKIITPEEDGKIYRCDCGEQYEKITDIENKKVNYISLCDSLELEYDRNHNKIVVRINYDYYRQLEIMLTDYLAVKKRDQDLSKIKGYLTYQKYIPQIEIEYFLSNNPILLINEMLKKRGLSISNIQGKIDTLKEGKQKKNLLNFLNQYRELLQKDGYKVFGDKKIEENRFRYQKKACEFIENNLGEIHKIMNW